MSMFKCVTMAKCGNMIIIDDKFNKVSALSTIDFSIITQRSTVDNDNSQYLFSAALANGNLLVGYDSQKLEVWKGDKLEMYR